MYMALTTGTIAQGDAEKDIKLTQGNKKNKQPMGLRCSAGMDAKWEGECSGVIVRGKFLGKLSREMFGEKCNVNKSKQMNLYSVLL